MARQAGVTSGAGAQEHRDIKQGGIAGPEVYQ